MTNAKMLATAVTAAMIAATSITVAPATAQQTIAPATVSDLELDAFVVAYKEVTAIEQDYGARLQDAGGDAEKQAIIGEAQVEMAQAVEAAPNIGVDRYIEILQLAQTDPELQAQLTTRLQD